MARRFSSAWMKALSVVKPERAWLNEYGPRIPTLPWVTTPMPPVLRELFDEFGRKVTLSGGERLFNDTMVMDFVMVQKGLTGRFITSDSFDLSDALLALSPVGRLAAGNLNFLTKRPTIGHYVALSDVELRMLSHVAAESLFTTRQAAFRAMLVQIEMQSLSDRMAFGIITMLPAMMRLKSLLLAWGAFFGTMKDGVLRLPAPGRTTHIERTIGVSSVTMDKLRAELSATADFGRDGDFLYLRADALEDIHAWMRHADGRTALYSRPARVVDFLEGMVRLRED